LVPYPLPTPTGSRENQKSRVIWEIGKSSKNGRHFFAKEDTLLVKYKTEQYLRNLGVFKSVLPLGPGWFLENFLK
jgi:hypothetical protein